MLTQADFPAYAKRVKHLINFIPDTWVDVGELIGLAKDEMRGLGHTSYQMKTAPEGALYVWCTNQESYAKALARRLERDDLLIQPACWLIYNLEVENFKGFKDASVAVDHAFFDLNGHLLDGLSRDLS